MRALLIVCLVPMLATAEETPSSQPINLTMSVPAQPAMESQPASIALERLELPPRRTPTKALALSVGLTSSLFAMGFFAAADSSVDVMRITSNTLLFSAVVLAPSAGHLYAKDKTHAITMSAARATALGVGFAGLYMISYSIGEDTRLENLAFPVTMVGASSLAGLILYDLVDSGFVMQRMKAKIRPPLVGRPLLMNLPALGR
jgi:hypothetical protein